MNIAFLLPSLSNKGPIIATKRLIESLKYSGIRIKVFYFDDMTEVEFPVETQRIKFWNRFNFSGFDIVHSTGIRPDLYISFFCRNLKIKRICSLHSYIEEDLYFSYGRFRSTIATWFWYKALRRFDRLITATNHMKSYYEQKLSAKNIVRIPYGIKPNDNQDIDEADKLLFNELKLKYYIIGNVSVLIKRKGLEQLIKLLSLRSNFCVVIIGDGEEKDRLLSLAKEYKVADRFFLLGSRADSIRYCRYFDIYIMPSRSEGFSLATIEAISQKVPVIVSRLPYYEEFFSSEEMGFFNIDDIDGLSIVIDDVMVRKKEYISNLFIVFKNNFTYEEVMDKHLALYTDCLTI